MTYCACGCVQRCDLWAWRRNEKRTETFMRQICRDYSRWHRPLKFCVRSRIREVVIYFKFHKNRSRVSELSSSSSSSRACPILERSRFYCPLPPFTILSPLPIWHQADVEWPQVLFSGTEPSSLRSTGRSFPIACQSRNNGSKNTCMVHSAVVPRDMTTKNVGACPAES